jgi:hypothetical protein
MDAFENFVYSYGAARDLLARAHRAGSLIEGLVLYVSLIDGLLRIALVLDKQLEDASGDVDFSYIQQEPGGRRYNEKEIYEQAHRRGIITTDMKAKIVDLYERRNAVIHRFFLTDIKYVDLEPWLSSYEEVHEHCYNIVDELESRQLRERKGMTETGPKADPEMISRAVREKLGFGPDPSSSSRGTRDGNTD